MDLLHAWWLLRLLFVFLLACPFLIVPVLLGFFKKHSDAKNRAEAPTEQGARVEISGLGTWSAQAGRHSQALQIERRAA
jgi:hypothetical protein